MMPNTKEKTEVKGKLKAKMIKGLKLKHVDLRIKRSFSKHKKDIVKTT